MAGLHIGRLKRYRQVAWSAGRCPYCQQLEALQIHNVIQITTINFIPVYRSVAGREWRCDFCERPVNPLPDASPTVLGKLWSPTDGLPALLGELGLPAAKDPPTTSDTRLRSLLDAVQTATSTKSLNAAPGAIAGAVVGLAVGILLGVLAFDFGWTLGGRDRFAAGMLSGIVCATAGAILGAVVYVCNLRHRIARRRLLGACQKYGLDRVRLHNLATQFNNETVCLAARTCRDSFDGQWR